MFYVIFAHILILFPRLLFAFDATYQTTDSTPIIPTLTIDHRGAYNSPWSLCRLDGLDLNYCGKISIRFGGAPFREAYYLEEYANKPASFFRNVSRSEAETLLANYHLPAYPSFFEKPWRFPTLGQLQFALDRNWVLTYSGNWYWFWNTESNSLDRLMYNGTSGGNTEAGKAHLERLFTEDFPSACEQNNCNKFYRDSIYFDVTFKKFGNHNMKYKFCTQRSNGSPNCDEETLGIGKTYIPSTGVYSRIWIEYCTGNNTGCYETYNIDLSLIKWHHENPSFCLAAGGNSSWTYLLTSFQTNNCTWNFYEEQGRSHSIFVWKDAAANIYWWIKYTDKNGNNVQPSSSVMVNSGTYTFPSGSSGHQYKACTGSACSKWGTITFNENYTGICISAHGVLTNPWTRQKPNINNWNEC